MGVENNIRICNVNSAWGFFFFNFPILSDNKLISESNYIDELIYWQKGPSKQYRIFSTEMFEDHSLEMWTVIYCSNIRTSDTRMSISGKLRNSQLSLKFQV